MRKKSIEFAAKYPEEYLNYPSWYTIQGGFQTYYTPITIPITSETFGIIHGDAHTGNWYLL